MPLFQSTPPRRGDKAVGKGKPNLREFQSTPPRRGDAPDPDLVRRQIRFQSTPPRRGDGPYADFTGQHHVVSIHAPAKGRPRNAVTVLPL